MFSTEQATWGALHAKKVFLKISQNSQTIVLESLILKKLQA